ARDDFPLNRSCHQGVPAICLTRRLPAQRIRRCDPNATFRTRLQQCDGDWSPLSPRCYRVAHAARLGTDIEIYDTVRLVSGPVNALETLHCRGLVPECCSAAQLVCRLPPMHSSLVKSYAGLGFSGQRLVRRFHPGWNPSEKACDKRALSRGGTLSLSYGM